jgi:PPOX class probable FMN-dependent enzyme
MPEEYALKTEFLVKDENELRSLFPATHALAAAKCLKTLDKHAIDFIARSPFLCIGTQTPDGTADVSPRGDPSGFVQVLDEKTVLIPDRPGNNRLDTQSNIVTNPSVGLLFLIPGFDETLRINGHAYITHDPDLLAMTAVQDRTSTTAIVVRIDEVFLHCAKAFRRSKLWNPSQHQDRTKMPSLMNMMLDQTSGAPDDPADMKTLDDKLEAGYLKSMY